MRTLYESPSGSRKSRAAAPRPGTIHDALLRLLLVFIYFTSELASRRRSKGPSLTYYRAAFRDLEQAGLVLCYS